MNSSLSADTRRRITQHIAELANPDQTRSHQAECRLICFGSKAIPLLLAMASSPDPQVRFRVVWILGKSKDVRALETIIGFTRDSDERVSYDAAMALGELGDMRAVPVLLELAASASAANDSALASAALSALAKLGIVLPEESGREVDDL